MHTVLRCQTTPREDFIFTATRLSRLLVEHALTQFPYDKCQVVTPTDSVYNGYHQNIPVCASETLTLLLSRAPLVLALLTGLLDGGLICYRFDVVVWCLDHACR